MLEDIPGEFLTTGRVSAATIVREGWRHDRECIIGRDRDVYAIGSMVSTCPGSSVILRSILARGELHGMTVELNKGFVSFARSHVTRPP